MDTEIIDQATATATLHRVRDNLDKATVAADHATKALRDGVVAIRPTGILTVDQMAEAVERDRNYIDSVWSSYGDTTKGKQTRVSKNASEVEVAVAEDRLASLADAQSGAAATMSTARAERDRVVAMVYASKILGPSAIAAAVEIDRNHVLRLCRKAGMAPMWRNAGAARNQHSAKAV